MTDLAHDLGAVLATEVMERAARSFIVGLGRCGLEGRPLTELQRIDLASALLTSFDGTSEALAGMLSMDAHLRTAPTPISWLTPPRVFEEDGA